MTALEHDSTYDVAIVGGGPAGLTAAIWLGRFLHSVLVVDSGDPRNWETRGIHGFPGSPDAKPAELRGAARDECRRYGVMLVDGTVAHVRRESEERYVLELATGERAVGRRLLLAYGLRDEWPDVPGLERAYGESAHVCPDCDGYESRGTKVVVIGSGRRAVGMSLKLANWSDDIVVCTNGASPDMDAALRAKLAALDIAVHEQPIVRLAVRQGNLRALEFADGQVLDCAHIFFSLGQHPADDIGVELGCTRDENGQIVVDDAHHTSVHNVFAAGDIIPGPQLAVRAAAGGAVAALAIHKSLTPPERRLD